jgi:NADPH:quinone reductase-like Zn-dependent oxidoreductase
VQADRVNGHRVPEIVALCDDRTENSFSLIPPHLQGTNSTDDCADTAAEAPRLAALAGFIEAGLLKPVIDRCWMLAEAAEAIRQLGRARGKVIVVMQ